MQINQGQKKSDKGLITRAVRRMVSEIFCYMQVNQFLHMLMTRKFNTSYLFLQCTWLDYGRRSFQLKLYKIFFA